ncbi:hypothetical protein [Corynebacterium riegelii]|uniref:hypothetical protein n=1 Tax=Corynebacterium riegelii TaxID=156976 RepID=UPI000A760588|nr:hypothetical protein [Corynebacterium riegelii]MDK7179822.1 hypothetical protein [Corynebacterium riegelii]
MTPLFHTNDASLSNDELAALSAVIADAQTRYLAEASGSADEGYGAGFGSGFGNVTHY